MSIVSAIRTSARPAAAFVAVGLFWGCFAAYVPVLKAGLDVSDGVFGLLLIGSAIGVVSSMWLAPLVDRKLGPRGMQAAALFFGLVVILPGLASGPVAFMIAVVFVGTGSGMLDVIMNSRVSDLEAKNKRSLMSANHGMFSVGYAAAALLAGALREAQVPPAAAFGLVGVIIWGIAAFLRMTPAVHDDGDTVHEAGYPLWPILLCGAVVLVAFMSEATVEAWSALHIERTLGGGAAEGALGPATLGLTMAFGRFSGQLVAERLREVTVVVWAALLSASGAIVAATAATPVIAYVGFGILGLGVSVIGPMGLALVGKIVAPRYRTEAISRAAVIGFSGFFFAPVLMGGLSQMFGLRWAFASVAILLLMAIPLSAALTRRYAAARRD